MEAYRKPLMQPTAKEWKTNTKYIDEETGEIVSKEQFRRYYTKTNHDKHVTTTNQKGVIDLTIFGKRKAQIDLFDDINR